MGFSAFVRRRHPLRRHARESGHPVNTDNAAHRILDHPLSRMMTTSRAGPPRHQYHHDATAIWCFNSISFPLREDSIAAVQTSRLARPQRPVWVTLPSRKSVRLVRYEHAATIVGLTSTGFLYNDPQDAKVRSVSFANFQRVSSYFGNMALVITN